MKKFFGALLLLLAVLLIVGCIGNHIYKCDILGHTWTAADCDTAKTCSVCHATDGEALGHSWTAASCDTAKTCSVCNATEGEALGHSWTAADCDTAKTCSVCHATEGEALGHSWTAADCDTAKTCSACHATEGEALGHSWAPADCDTAKTCSVCHATEGEALGHSWTAADCDTAKTCSVCHATEGEALGHNYSQEWTSDETGHWYECSCGDKKDFAEHQSAGPATEENNEICSVCEYVISLAISHTHNFNLKVETDSTLKAPATCTENAVYWFSCSCNQVSDELYYEKENSSKGHAYIESYVWNDDLSKVTATLVCENDSSHSVTEEVTTSYEVINASTTTVKGLGRYTATFENNNFTTQIKDVELDLVATKTYYFVPGVWAENDATFGIRVSNATSEEIFMPVVLGESGLYEITCSIEMTHISIFRYDSTSTIWWNGVEYLEIPANKDMFVITSWESYLWDEYLTVDNAAEFVEGDTLYLQLNGDWGSAVSASGFAIQFEGLNGSSDIMALEVVDSTNGIYKITVPASGFIRVRFAQVNPSNVYEIWNVSDYIYCDHDSNTNLIKLQSGWASMKGNWSTYSE